MDAASALSAGLDEADIHHGFVHPLEEPVQIKGFAVTYDRKFNLGNFESLNSAIHVWVKSVSPEGEAFGLHDCKGRVRRAELFCTPTIPSAAAVSLHSSARMRAQSQ